MTQHRKFDLENLDQLRSEIERLGLDIPVSEDLSVLGEKCVIAGRSAPNRFVAQPMEGYDAEPDGSPGELTFRRYERFARGGFGLIWLEATAVLPEARSHPRQLFLNEQNVASFGRLVQTIRKAATESFGRDVVLILQLTHSGRYSKPEGTPKPIIAHHSPVLDPVHNLPPEYPIVSDGYLDNVRDTLVAAARLAGQAGFDGVDIKSCHCYLISELLAAVTREGRYGGSLENRTRLLRETIAGISSSVPAVFPTTRMNAYDGFPYPFGFGSDPNDPCAADLREPVELAKMLTSMGVPLLNVSAGNPAFNPYITRPFDRPLRGAQPPAEHPLIGVGRLLGFARAIQAAVPGRPVIGSGYSWLRHFLPHVAAGVIKKGWAAFAGAGRGAIAYPDIAKDILENGRMDPDKCCVTCSGCSALMRKGERIGCIVRDGKVYRMA